MNIDAFGIHIGPLYLRYYGLILMAGAFAGAYLASLEAKRRDLNTDHVWDGLIWALVGGIIGARLWHILTPPPSMVEAGITTRYYFEHPLEALAIWNGGLGILGAVVGGLLGLYLFVRRRGLKMGEWVDLAAPGIALGQAIGRWGNYFNQELYGRVTELPWGLDVAIEYRLPEHVGLPESTRFHPTFLYESLWNLLAFFLLSYVSRRFGDQLRRGDLALFYLILYPLGRFLAELQRPDAWLWQGMPVAQIVSVGLMAVCGLLLLWRHGVFGGGRRQLTD